MSECYQMNLTYKTYETKNVNWDIIGLSEVRRTNKEIITIKNWQHILYHKRKP